MSLGGGVYSDQNLQRLARLLPGAAFPDDVPLAALASKDGLQSGRRVLLTKCVVCHDLKTILIKPRIPVDWVRTVVRMAAKPVVGQPIKQREQWVVAAYLIAISPDLQASQKQRRTQLKQQAEARDAIRHSAVEPPLDREENYDFSVAKELFENTCTMCHELDEMDSYSLTNDQEVRDLVGRMVENGMEAEEEEMEQIIWYINQEYIQ